MRSWTEPKPITVPSDVQAAVGGHPLVARTIIQRGISEPSAAIAFLDPNHYQPASPQEMPGIDLAIERLVAALSREERICVWGDFDVDGQTSTTLLVSALREHGGDISYHIPVRATESHGVNLPGLKDELAKGAQLILTCDTGITANEAVEYAQCQGVDVIITDHHDLPPELPPAFAVVNPKMLPEEHPLATLPGVGVAYKLVEALYHHFRRENDIESFLDLVALGIVADVALQRADTRYLLQRGLAVLRNSQRLGLQVLMEMAGLQPASLTEEHIGFIIGPRLNALGRLSDANEIVDFLTTDDLSAARMGAHRLEGLNTERKLLTEQVFKGTLAQIESNPELGQLSVIVLAHTTWPAGVIGIVASRLVERYSKPVVLISTPDGELARGSARSIEGINITQAIATQGDLLQGFGGHPMAAGLAMDRQKINDFRAGLARTVQAMRKDLPDEPPLQIDAELSFSELSLDLVADLERLAPFGAGNPAVVLQSCALELVDLRTVGQGEVHRIVKLKDEQGCEQKVIWWQGSDWPEPTGKIDLAYKIRSSSFRGVKELQLEWIDSRPAVSNHINLDVAPTEIEVIDYRLTAEPRAYLNKLAAQADTIVWNETGREDGLPGVNRTAMSPHTKLVIWSAPPGPDELHQALMAVRPGVAALFANPSATDTVEDFLKYLLGLVKYALRKYSGITDLVTLAAACGQRTRTVALGLAWLEAQGQISVTISDFDDVTLSPYSSTRLDHTGRDDVISRLVEALEETKAYRKYFQHADKDILIHSSIRSPRA
jgi:single-stranded-DNA-specific exonuclease